MKLGVLGAVFFLCCTISAQVSTAQTTDCSTVTDYRDRVECNLNASLVAAQDAVTDFQDQYELETGSLEGIEDDEEYQLLLARGQALFDLVTNFDTLTDAELWNIVCAEEYDVQSESAPEASCPPTST